MKLLLADHQAHLKFAPLTLTRPVGALRCGIYTNAERWSKCFPEAAIGFETEAYLQAKFPAVEGIKINAQVLPNEELAAALQALPENTSLYSNELWLATNGEAHSKINYTGENPIILKERWDLFEQNDAVLKADFLLATGGRQSGKLSKSNTLIGATDQLFIEEGAVVEGAILNTKTGPIYIG
ncbi:MAG: putative sugar nucleotidyl transferase, partial [Crocinitomicaceae bacterium]